uniref:Uncharacterized protein n=1 Tax=viral metagenome TaxID=1070528 RepID=A0A6H1ZUD7_9ZZZZ
MTIVIYAVFLDGEADRPIRGIGGPTSNLQELLSSDAPEGSVLCRVAPGFYKVAARIDGKWLASVETEQGVEIRELKSTRDTRKDGATG